MTDIESDTTTYRHTQKASWYLLLYAMAIVFLVTSWFSPIPEPLVNVTFLVIGLLMLLLGGSFHHLTVADEGAQLAVRFGPFPLFRRRIWYDDIRTIEKGRTTLRDGWGIHWSLRGGWVWNIWGRDCVIIHLERAILRIGTDDPEGLLRFLERRVAPSVEA